MSDMEAFWERRYNEQHRTVHAMEDELARLRPVVEAARKMDGARFDEDCGKPDCVECVAFRALNAALAAYDAGEPDDDVPLCAYRQSGVRCLLPLTHEGPHLIGDKPVVTDEMVERAAIYLRGVHQPSASLIRAALLAALDGER